MVQVQVGLRLRGAPTRLAHTAGRSAPAVGGWPVPPHTGLSAGGWCVLPEGRPASPRTAIQTSHAGEAGPLMTWPSLQVAHRPPGRRELSRALLQAERIRLPLLKQEVVKDL